MTSASNAQADSLCPGRHLAIQAMPPRAEQTTADSEHGRKIHAVLKDSGDEARTPTLTVEQREIKDACREIEKALMAQYFGGKPDSNVGATPTGKVFREERIWCMVPIEGGGVIEHSGQPDVIHRRDTRALILEYKTLAGDVPDSPKNMQLRDQAVLAYGRFGGLLTEVAVAIVQPLVTRTPEMCIYDKAALQEAERQMFDRVRRSNLPGQIRVAGEEQCKFCAAKTSCDEYSRWVGSMAPAVTEPLAQAAVFSMAMDKWSPEERAIAARMLPAAFKALDEIKAYLKGLLKADPEAIPGFYLKNGVTRETIKDPQACYERFEKLGGDLAGFMRTVIVAKGALKQELSNATGAKGKALEEAMTAITKGIVESSQNEPSLAAKDH